MNTVIFTGWNDGLKKISLTSLLRDKAGLSLTQAKLNVDAIVNGVIVEVNCTTITKMESLVKEATKLGAICKISKKNLVKA